MLIICPKCSVKYKIPSEIKLSEGKKMQCSACQHIFEFHNEREAELDEKPRLLPPDDAVLSFNSKTECIIAKTSNENPVLSPSPVLPEAFRPIQLQKTSPKIPYFMGVLCIVLLTGFMIMTWMYRDLLINHTLVVPTTAPYVHRLKHKPTVVQPHLQEPPLLQKEELTVAVADLPKEEPRMLPLPRALPSVQSVRFRKTPTGEAVLIEGVLKNTTSETLPVPEKIYALAYNTQGQLVFKKEIYLPTGLLYPDMEQPFFGTYMPVKEEIQWVDVVLEK